VGRKEGGRKKIFPLEKERKKEGQAKLIRERENQRKPLILRGKGKLYSREREKGGGGGGGTVGKKITRKGKGRTW